MAISVRLPAVCDICGMVFPSAIEVGGNSPITTKNIGAGTCPNGHLGAYIPDGTYSLRNGIMQIVSGAFGNKSDLGRIHAIAKRAKTQTQGYQLQAIDQIAALLPEESRTAIKQLGAQNPVTVILLVLFFISLIANQLGTAYRAFFPSDPAPTTIINNITNVHTGTPADTGKEPGAQRPPGVGGKKHGVENQGAGPPKGEGDKSMLHPKSSKRRDRRQRGKAGQGKSPL